MKIRFFTLVALALALAACNNDNENLNGDPVAAQFTANIAPATRASGTTWTAGGRIGITDIGNDTQYGNVPFILKNGKFEAEGKVIYIEDTKTKLDTDDRIPHYDIDFVSGGYEYEVEVNAKNGRIHPTLATGRLWGSMVFYPEHAEGNGSAVFKPLQLEG